MALIEAPYCINFADVPFMFLSLNHSENLEWREIFRQMLELSWIVTIEYIFDARVQ